MDQLCTGATALISPGRVSFPTSCKGPPNTAWPCHRNKIKKQRADPILACKPCDPVWVICCPLSPLPPHLDFFFNHRAECCRPQGRLPPPWCPLFLSPVCTVKESALTPNVCFSTISALESITRSSQGSLLRHEQLQEMLFSWPLGQRCSISASSFNAGLKRSGNERSGDKRSRIQKVWR